VNGEFMFFGSPTPFSFCTPPHRNWLIAPLIRRAKWAFVPCPSVCGSKFAPTVVTFPRIVCWLDHLERAKAETVCWDYWTTQSQKPGHITSHLLGCTYIPTLKPSWALRHVTPIALLQTWLPSRFAFINGGYLNFGKWVDNDIIISCLLGRYIYDITSMNHLMADIQRHMVIY